MNGSGEVEQVGINKDHSAAWLPAPSSLKIITIQFVNVEMVGNVVALCCGFGLCCGSMLWLYVVTMVYGVALCCGYGLFGSML